MNCPTPIRTTIVFVLLLPVYIVFTVCSAIIDAFRAEGKPSKPKPSGWPKLSPYEKGKSE